MRKISSKEYALEITDVIDGKLYDAVRDAWQEVATKYGIEYGMWNPDAVATSFACGFGATVRDSLVELFEECGMDIRPDDKEW